MCVYIYIYILGSSGRRWPSSARRAREGCRIGAKDYTPQITKVIVHLKMPWKSIGIVQWKSTGEVTILWTIQLKSETPLENATDNPLTNATENPRWFLRGWFLVCNLLPPQDEDVRQAAMEAAVSLAAGLAESFCETALTYHYHYHCHYYHV